LSVNSHLLALNLTGNQMKEKGVKEVIEGLGRNGTLTSLRCSFNEFSQDIKFVVAEVIRFNSALLELDLRGGYGDRDVNSSLEGNKTLVRLIMAVDGRERVERRNKKLWKERMKW